VYARLLLSLAAAGQAPADSAPRLTFGGFADVYYAYDFGRPASIDRAFTTQPARHNEFNVNLVHLEARLDGSRVRGRLALQAGTSVQSNYAGEPAFGSVSGPSLSRHIQEAVAGVRLADGLWLDAGIYLSHIGSESWLSRDNPTYTRSLIADYSPYYHSGAKLTWAASSRVTAQLNVGNGWQIISDNNGAKSVGVRVDIAASSRATLSVYNHLGNEQPDTVPSRLRAFQGASLKLLPSDKLTLVGTFDFGWQDGAGSADGSSWYGTALIGRIQASPKVAVAARLERYHDPDQVIIATGTANGFQVSGGSFGIDVVPVANFLWRTEVRAFDSKDAIYPKRSAAGGLSGGNAFVVSSIALAF
jgi:hypothetical protein